MSIPSRAHLTQDPEVLTAPVMTVSAIRPFLSHQAIDRPPAISWGIERMKADHLPDTAGRGAKVAVLDTGIDPDHPAFEGVSISSCTFTDAPEGDVEGFGTHAAGTILGRDVAGTRIGVARGVNELLVGKVLGPDGGNTANLLKAILWARDMGAHVIYLALRHDVGAQQEQLMQQGLHPKEAAAIALSHDRENVRLFAQVTRLLQDVDASRAPLIIAAAGNESERPRFTLSVGAPASDRRVLSVGALDESGNAALFSNTDPDLAAPGTEIWSARPGGGLAALSGTGMAAAHVAGLAAFHAGCMLSDDRFNAAELRRLIIHNLAALPGQGPLEVGGGLARAPDQ